MAANRGDLEEKKNNLDKNWIKTSKLHADELKLLKTRLRNKSVKGSQLEEILISSEYFKVDQTNWGLKIRQYLEAESISKEPTSNPKAAAKLAALNISLERKLITAIELARGGYVISSLHSILSITKHELLKKEERIEVFLLTIELIIVAINSDLQRSRGGLSVKELLHHLTFTKKLIKSLKLALSAAENNLCDIPAEVLDLISLSTGETAPTSYKEEAFHLCVADERKLIKQKLSDIHRKPVIRSIHHLACTGGTLFSKCLASMHNVALISEVNPLNRSGSRFEPTNPLLLLERNYREFSTGERIGFFKTQLKQAYNICLGDDVDLVLRDHSHTDFHSGGNTSQLCPIRDCLSDEYELISIVTIRHPLDSYLSLLSNGWEKHFHPNDINEYSRRYLAFVEKYSNLQFIRYENLCADPVREMKSICEILSLQYNENFLQSFGNHQLSGDSGRKGLQSIKQRPRRQIPEGLEDSLQKSEFYLKLIERLGY